MEFRFISREDGRDQEGGDGAPVCREFGRVAVDAVEVVHVWDRDVAFTDDVVTRQRELVPSISGFGSGFGFGKWARRDELSHQNTSHGPQKNRIPAQESQELRG